jgi:hypothetical protein
VKVQDALKLFKTGVPLFVSGTSFMSEAIEVLEDGQMSHAATFYWDDKTPMVAEENERDGGVNPILNAGFEIVPFYEWLTQQEGKIYFGTASQIVYDHPEKVIELICWYKSHPMYQHYGFGSLLPIFINHWLSKIDSNINIPILTWAEVCDTFSIALENNAGANFPTNETPDDFANRSKPLTLLEV